MCNVYLHRLDRDWDTRTYGVLVRFADDLLVMCKSRQQAQAALTRLRELLADLGLAPKEAKTRIVELAVGGEGVDFLGFHHRMVRSRGTHGRRGVEFLARWPSDRAMRRARDRITELTVRSRLRLPVEEVVKDLNRFLRGWAGYFRYGNSAARLQDRAACTSSARIVHRQAAQTRARLRLVRAGLQVGGPLRVAEPGWNRDRAQGCQALAGEAECRR